MATYGERLVRVDFDTPSIPEVGEIKRRCAELIDFIVDMQAPEPTEDYGSRSSHDWTAYDMMQADKKEAIRSVAHASMMGVKAATQWKSDGTPY